MKQNCVINNSLPPITKKNWSLTFLLLITKKSFMKHPLGFPTKNPSKPTHMGPIFCQCGPICVRLGGFSVGTPICIPSGLSYQKPTKTNTHGPHITSIWGPYGLVLVGYVWASPSASHLGFVWGIWAPDSPDKTQMGPIYSAIWVRTPCSLAKAICELLAA